MLHACFRTVGPVSVADPAVAVFAGGVEGLSVGRCVCALAPKDKLSKRRAAAHLMRVSVS